jgi:hypothetical protein
MKVKKRKLPKVIKKDKPKEPERTTGFGGPGYFLP